jgi:hypothetical protein
LAIETPPPREAPRLLCLFHLNLAFSSLEEESHAEVIRRCYRPALELARETGFPIAVEATGWTLRRIAQLDPGWIELLRELLAEGSAEFVGSAHAQCAAPLLPARLNVWNLRLGREVYLELLGVAPRVALVCEQVYSPGLVPLYLEAGYEALIVDWDNARRSHPRWPDEFRLHPQRARGGGRTIPILWSKSIAFQKFQRFAHGELSLERYLAYVCEVSRGAVPGRALVLYANDVEIFDHRPGRFAAEPELRDGEWIRIAEGLRALCERNIGIPALPSELLGLLGAPGAGRELELESPSQPIPVKKQDKYNVSRWAVSGRDDVGINTRCWRLYERLARDDCTDTDPERWRELCELWASDFRTHVTDSRWRAYIARLENVERLWRPSPPSPVPPLYRALEPLVGRVARAWDDSEPRDRSWFEGDSDSNGSAVVSDDGDSLELRAGTLALKLNLRRGMAIDALTDTDVAECPLLGTLEHGYFPTIDLGADFYSGHLVQESPLTHKVTDLKHVRPRLGFDQCGRLSATARISTELGPVEKTIRLNPPHRDIRDARAAVEIEWVLRWRELPLGSLRLGHVTLLPESFETHTLWYATHNGGAESETHFINCPAFDHGAAVSALVTARQGLGLTEGVVLLGDARRTIRVEVDRACARPLGLVSWVPGRERWFLRLCFALTESDETRRGSIPRDLDDPQRMRMRISAERTASVRAESLCLRSAPI